MMCLMCCELHYFSSDLSHIHFFPVSSCYRRRTHEGYRIAVLTISKHPVHYVPSLISPRVMLEMLELALPHRLLIISTIFTLSR